MERENWCSFSKLFFKAPPASNSCFPMFVDSKEGDSLERIENIKKIKVHFKQSNITWFCLKWGSVGVEFYFT